MLFGGAKRDRIAALFALTTAMCLAATFIFSNGLSFLMPGPLTSAHGTIEKCSACHSKSGEDKTTWVSGLVAGDAHTDSKACLTCHKMPASPFNAHSATADVLQQSTARLTKVAALSSPPSAAHVQSVAFPTQQMMSDGMTCATCHQEHQGAQFKLNEISNEQCRSCHVVKFNSFDTDHPAFEKYPFNRRTKIIFDHAGHFGKHYPEVAKKDATKTIPATCSTCHNTRDDKRVMAVAPFEQTCATCHLDQIQGKERASGPKGIAFLSLPGIDVETLKAKNAAMGEWPADSEAALTPFMKVMISQTEAGRTALKAIDSLNLQDLSTANDAQISAVAELTWEVKTLFHSLINGKASDALGNLNVGQGAKLSPSLAADLTASIPRDVLVSAQQQWLPNLMAEIAKRTGKEIPQAAAPAPSADAAAPEEKADEPAESASSDASGDTGSDDADDKQSDESEDAEEKSQDKPEVAIKRDPPACSVRVFGQCLVYKQPAEQSAQSTQPKDDVPPAAFVGGDPSPSQAFPAPMRLGGTQLAQASDPPKASSSGQSDELLNLTDEEQKAMKARGKTPAKPVASTGGADAQAVGTTEIAIDSGVDPEAWADYGGWYRQDHAILYRPVGHKDKFIFAWLFLTGPQAPKDDPSPSSAIFNLLTHKDAQGSCTKCHSVDALPGGGRLVNFAPPKAEAKQGRFTSFIHEPHYSIQDDRGCLTCHSMSKDRAYLKSFEQGDPHAFESNFGDVKKETCQTCHNKTTARQDCVQCHKYHINGVVTPIMATKNPIK